MSDLLETPVEGTVAADTFTSHLPADEINISLVEEWRAYLTDCLKNNFAVRAKLHVASSGGTTLWIPEEKTEAPNKQKLIQEFARECLHDFIRLCSGRRLGFA